ncbi:hypothetical protein GGU10DRAFT_379539 [Lentinula aff. detonsa]|uniref:Uncharacterized protein n=1 Tax=Lentinula aff. detonsa TaxID=2804958 RepID=A0AA38KP37_9AGAR|nr:hypothetical protein GGU10DRAFT_379539 [Lentinula aff. detonsa]
MNLESVSLSKLLVLGCTLFLGTSRVVNATAWVAGYQSSGYTGWNLRQYTYLYEGNPREAAYLGGSDENTLPGAVCDYWTEWNIIGNPNPGQFKSPSF